MGFEWCAIFTEYAGKSFPEVRTRRGGQFTSWLLQSQEIQYMDRLEKVRNVPLGPALVNACSTQQSQAQTQAQDKPAVPTTPAATSASTPRKQDRTALHVFFEFPHVQLLPSRVANSIPHPDSQTPLRPPSAFGEEQNALEQS